MLRRQVHRPMRKPLVVMTPKSLLRRKESTSALAELASGSFQCVIGDPARPSPKKVRRVVFCSGKVYFDIAAERDKRGIEDVALVRIEQLYPFPHTEFAEQIALYAGARSVVWAQEEPANQGAWHRIQHYLLEHLRPDQALTAAQRRSSASPAVGYLALHNQQQKEIIDAALTLEPASSKKAAD
jgi:2-oxoglutarate dehydrogenase E1 component